MTGVRGKVEDRWEQAVRGGGGPERGEEKRDRNIYIEVTYKVTKYKLLLCTSRLLRSGHVIG